MGRSVVITGGAGGIGSALARAFVARGDRVALLDLDPDRLDAVAATFPLQSVHAQACDVTDPASIQF